MVSGQRGNATPHYKRNARAHTRDMRECEGVKRGDRRTYLQHRLVLVQLRLVLAGLVARVLDVRLQLAERRDVLLEIFRSAHNLTSMEALEIAWGETYF